MPAMNNPVILFHFFQRVCISLILICSFSLQAFAAPSINGQLPLPESYGNSLQPLIQTTVSSVNGINPASVQMSLDGSPIFPLFTTIDSSTEIVSYQVVTEMPNDSVHLVELTISDLLGNSSTSIWSFEVSNYPDMTEQNQACLDCHAPAIPEQITLNAEKNEFDNPTIGPFNSIHINKHDMNMQHIYNSSDPNIGRQVGHWLCLNCHWDGKNRDGIEVEEYYSATDQLFPRDGVDQTLPLYLSFNYFPETHCQRCHFNRAGATVPALPPWTNLSSLEYVSWISHDYQPENHFDCATCHQQQDASSYPDVKAASTGHNLFSSHQIELAESCQACHSRVLTREHAQPGRTDGESNPIECSTCHSSANDSIKQISGRSWLDPNDRWESGYGEGGFWGPALPADNTYWTYNGGEAVHKIKLSVNGTGTGILRGMVDGSWQIIYQKSTLDWTWDRQVIDIPGSGATAFQWNFYIASWTSGWNHINFNTGIKAGLVVLESATPSTAVTCSSCHASADHTVLHDVTDLLTVSCQECHIPNLISEHEAKAAGYSCDICHASSDPNVTNAIATGDRNCAACHGSADHTVLHDMTDLLAVSCQACHIPNLISEHEAKAAGYSCDICHASSDPNVINAVVAGDRDCVACHGGNIHQNVNHTATLGNGVVALFPDNGHDDAGWSGDRPYFGVNVDCSLCHNNDLPAIHGNDCSTCHPSPYNTLGTWNRGCQQGGCHVEIHDGSFAAHWPFENPYDAGNDCNRCHNQSNFEVVQANCLNCHAPDGAPPVTTANIQVRTDGAVVIDFSSTDGGHVGIIRTFYRLDSGTTTVAAQLVVTDPGSHVIEYWSVDQAGNIESPANAATFIVGASTPVVLGSSQANYATIRQAYDSIQLGGSDTIEIKASYPLIENLVLDRNVSVLLEGGYDDVFGSIISATTLNGPLTFSSGQVTVSNIIIK